MLINPFKLLPGYGPALDALAKQVIALDQCVWTRNRDRLEALCEVVELLADYKLDRISCGARHSLFSLKELDDALDRFRRGLGVVPASDRRRHGELYRDIVALVNRSDFDRLKYAQQEVRARITEIEDKDISSTNKSSSVFERWCGDGLKQADFDLNTILARLYETDAKLLLMDNLSSRTLKSEVAERIAELLDQAEKVFRKSSEIWWHGYGNVMLTRAVLASLQNNREESGQLLLCAREIFLRTNDLMRANMVFDIMNPWLDFRELGLDEQKMRLLLFGE